MEAFYLNKLQKAFLLICCTSNGSLFHIDGILFIFFFKYASFLLKSHMDVPLQQTPAASYPRDAAYNP